MEMLYLIIKLKTQQKWIYVIKVQIELENDPANSMTYQSNLFLFCLISDNRY